LLFRHSAVGSDASSRRVNGLDSIRFLCAAVVMIFHLGLINDRLYGQSEAGLARDSIGIFNSFFNGPAAVIVFFVISGFCIHYPNKDGRKLLIVPFYIRRFIRILLPAGVCYLGTRWLFHDRTRFQDGVLWSVVCEAIYYLIYPQLLYLRRKSSWLLLLLISSAGAGLLIFTHLSSLSYGLHSYVALNWYTWIVGLPCWLLGCWLAENYLVFPLLSPLQMWGMRIGIYGLSVALQLLRFHLHTVLASNCILLDLFSLPVCLWLGFEIIYLSKHAPPTALEWAGSWSYSLYLIHPVMLPAFAVLGLRFILLNSYTHFLVLGAALIASYVYFLCIERPSHRLSITASRAAKAYL
jgi:peptidoglycan/LPS O-acetylase OafA/YrhL